MGSGRHEEVWMGSKVFSMKKGEYEIRNFDKSIGVPELIQIGFYIMTPFLDKLLYEKKDKLFWEKG